ncbi:MAG: hydantoinase B/oxoprolinase family protein [Gammaproteobacteria bacterium]
MWLTLRSILLDTEKFGNVPQNAGLYRPINIYTPPGCLANAIFPAPTIARVTPGNILADTLMHALAPLVPHQISAGIANLKAIGFAGIRDDQQWMHIEFLEGRYCGRSGKNGMDSVDTLYANRRNNPIEDIETHSPLRVNRYELRDHVCAHGRCRGEIGSIKEIEFLADRYANSEGDGHAHAPRGFDSGHAGITSETLFVNNNGDVTACPSMMTARAAKNGEKFIAIDGCGGGYGDPKKRQPAQVLSDLLDGYITQSEALEIYAVIMQQNKFNEPAPNDLRKKAVTN